MYKIESVQDVSRPRCKRFVAHIIVDYDDKEKVKTAIAEATKAIKETDDYSNETTKRKFDCPAHVVRLYVHFGKRLICQSMWIDNTLKNVPLPIPLKYNDTIDDIGIVWL